MKQRLADYVADFLVEHGITDCFSVVGGGAMHLNDALGHKEGLKVTYQHHEQACAMAAECYARYENRIAALCVTTGPGGTNAITGVLGGYLDSIPMLVISGQVRYDTTARYASKFAGGMSFRAVGDQEYDIVKSVKPMTKYATMIEDPMMIRYALERGIHLAKSGRPGPVWIDIPVNYQGMTIETDNLVRYNPVEDASDELRPIEENIMNQVLDALKSAERPVIYAGNGIRISGAHDDFLGLVDKAGIPVVTYLNTIDLIETAHPLYTGRGGSPGDRAGNFAVQNSDLVLAIGTRLSVRQTGYNFDTWAREAKVIMVDADAAEMRKHTIHVDIAVRADAGDFIRKLSEMIMNHECDFGSDEWRETCRRWKMTYPVVTKKQLEMSEEPVNVYAFTHILSDLLPEGSLSVSANGACSVAGAQDYIIKKGSRFVVNSGVAAMGYGLPASIGFCMASGRRDVVCLEGDGSIMMNLQELQTVVTNHLPIKLFLVNNQGYHSIRITQSNLFSEHDRVGIGPESGDLSFPDFNKISNAFGVPYKSIKNRNEMISVIKEVLGMDGAVFCEVFTDISQVWEPKSSPRKLEDGSLVSPPLEDLAPFLPRDVFEREMIIPIIDE